MSYLSFSDDAWTAVENEPKRSFIEQIHPVDGRLAVDDDAEVHCRPLPMYDDVKLLCVTSRQWAPELRICYLTDDKGNLFRLNGTSPPIHEVNAQAPIKLTDENVLYYLSFFCFFVRGQEGPFYLLSAMDDDLLPDGFAGAHEPGTPDGPTPERLFRRPRIFGRNDEGHWQASALVFYHHALFFSDFLIQPTGMIQMADDQPLISNLGCRIDAPLTPPAG